MSEPDFWIRIGKDLSVEQYIKPDLALRSKTKYWLQACDNGKTHLTSYGNRYTLFDYNIFNSVLDECDIVEQSLKVKYIYDSMTNNFSHQISCSIYDVNDKYASKKFSGDTLFDCILKFFTYVKIYGIYKTWDFIDLHETIDNKEMEINRLWAIIKERNDEIEELKKRLSK